MSLMIYYQSISIHQMPRMSHNSTRETTLQKFRRVRGTNWPLFVRFLGPEKPYEEPELQATSPDMPLFFVIISVILANSSMNDSATANTV